jgi:hypothetical protein
MIININETSVPIKSIFKYKKLYNLVEEDFAKSLSLDYNLWYYNKFFIYDNKIFSEFAHIKKYSCYSGSFFSLNIFDIIKSETLPYKEFYKDLYCVIVNISPEYVETKDFLSLEEAKYFSKLYLELI